MYLIFVGDTYYPGGGWKDFRCTATSLHDAVCRAANEPGDWWQVVDLDTKEIVEEGFR